MIFVFQEPLALASGALPDWCEQLTSKCPFLIPFETRQLYFTCTAFGASRSVLIFFNSFMYIKKKPEYY